MAWLAPPQTLIQLWRNHRAECRPVGEIFAEARAGVLPGVTPHPCGFGFNVTDSRAALDAMMARKDAA